jgi:hypothetical protein
MQEAFDILEAVERFDKRKVQSISKFELIGRIVDIGHIAPVAQWIE